MTTSRRRREGGADVRAMLYTDIQYVIHGYPEPAQIERRVSRPAHRRLPALSACHDAHSAHPSVRQCRTCSCSCSLLGYSSLSFLSLIASPLPLRGDDGVSPSPLPLAAAAMPIDCPMDCLDRLGRRGSASLPRRSVRHFTWCDAGAPAPAPSLCLFCLFCFLACAQGAGR